jgi:hypothetical protein
MQKPNGKATTTPTETTTPTDTSNYGDAVREGKEIVKRQNADQMRLGQLAYMVETKHKDETLAKYAREIGIEYQTLKRYRGVYGAWVAIQQKVKGAAPPQSFEAAKELAPLAKDHAEAAAKIARNNPKIASRQAKKLAQKILNGGEQDKAKDRADWWRQEQKNWLHEIGEIAKAALIQATVPRGLTPERRQGLLDAMDAIDDLESFLPGLEQGGEALINLAKFLRDLLVQEQNEEEDHFLRSTKEPSARVEVA